MIGGKKFEYADSPFGAGAPVITLKPYTGTATTGAQVAQEFIASIQPPPGAAPPPAPVVHHGWLWRLFHRKQA